jgi:phenolic acid decarboxylase
MTTTTTPLPPGTQVEFDIGQGLAAGRAAIIAVDYDDGWLYQLDVVAGDHAADHRNEAGELWVCDFEVRAVGDHQPRV